MSTTPSALHSPAAVPDRQALRACWHPVAFADRPGTEPRRVTLLGEPIVLRRDFEDTIFEQDRRVVESQRPEVVPFDLADELHLTFDAVAVAYRRAMRAPGPATDRPHG
jgi:phenylpropionate dioxygenase-like ring-hydroxylating dioxygenase large terminal subunit